MDKELSEKYGIPNTIVVNDAKRYPDCVAHEAILESVEGEHVIYKGVCPMGHMYTERMTLKKARQRNNLVVENGEVTIGSGQGYDAEPLEEY